MSETNCTHNCNTCGESCSSRQTEQTSFLEPLNPASTVKKVIGVVSGKGGVGKSLVTTMMAVRMNAKNYKTAILDADITGPSIPKAFGLGDDGVGMTPTGLMIPATTSMWEDIDYMFVDMPPGTGDVPLTVFQSLPVDGIIIVTSPQELVSMIVTKAVNMAKKMNIPILGLVENMSYLSCPDCGKKISVFGESRIDEVAKENEIPVLAKIPIEPKIAKAVDEGAVEYLEAPWLDEAVKAVESI